MKIRMLKDAPGSPDGVTVEQYVKDEVYEVTHALATAFLRFKLAVEHKPALTKKDVGPTENKQDSAPAETK